ncbi:MAG: NifB/NifX family molybdenum-iron cluster-binding protein [Thermoplasmatota archaeon]
MTTAIPTGDRFARSPSFIIDGEEVKNPCVDELPAADCCVDFLVNHNVDKVIFDNIGFRAKNLLEDKGITYISDSGTQTLNTSDQSDFEKWLANKGKFLGFTALIIGSTYGLVRLYKYLKK